IEAGGDLLAGGERFTNLTAIFAAHAEAVYIDLCHLNQAGNDVLADRIAEAIRSGTATAAQNSRLPDASPFAPRKYVRKPALPHPPRTVTGLADGVQAARPANRGRGAHRARRRPACNAPQVARHRRSSLGRPPARGARTPIAARN